MRENAPSITSWIVVPFGWTCHPAYAVPSYATVSLTRRDIAPPLPSAGVPQGALLIREWGGLHLRFVVFKRSAAAIKGIMLVEK
jgi:hypothetical protein